MIIRDLANSGAIPALEQMLRFAGQRQRLIANNVANLTTPDYQPLDVSVQGFQKTLAKAIDQRRRETGGELGELQMSDTAEVVQRGGALTLRPRTASGNILFHDRNNRDLERTMQAQAENLAAFRVAADLLRSRTDLLRGAIAQRV